MSRMIWVFIRNNGYSASFVFQIHMTINYDDFISRNGQQPRNIQTFYAH